MVAFLSVVHYLYRSRFYPVDGGQSTNGGHHVIANLKVMGPRRKKGGTTTQLSISGLYSGLD